ncbi:N-acetylmuramoyl-L-alanine amidase [Paludibacterium paludis]|uniref:N-acetylmuramoyl-L-alanine amidase n=1 Tax=Paludibacterium paludis TaxID=1225769 RepID=A0A918NY80_9NEIS|nr:N-acetylmuramoyl-L-alanine amidase [Paludibacterium paludis]GGY06490.1 protein AmpDh3 [Paludibacterium paludis]
MSSSKINYTAYRTTTGYGKRVRFLVLHYTAMDFAASTVTLTRQQVGAHYLIPALSDTTYRDAGFTTAQIFNLVDEADRAWHAGVSHWAGRDNLNDTSIGIEIVNLARDERGSITFPDYEDEQIALLKDLLGNILMRYPDISPKNIVGHADIAYTRKSDPGPKFPWQALHQSGIGAWYDSSVKEDFRARFATTLPDRSEIVNAFKRYGYLSPANDGDYRKLVRAFQMHFRPSGYDGTMDAETCAILYALNARYA